ARRAPRAVGALLGFDGDGERRADRLAQLAGDAALLAVRIAPQRMQPAETRAQRRLLLRILDGDLALEQVVTRDPQPVRGLHEQEGVEEVPDALDHLRSPSGTDTPSASASSPRER